MCVPWVSADLRSLNPWAWALHDAWQQLRANGYRLDLLEEELRVRACVCACMTAVCAPFSCERPGREGGCGCG